MRNCFIIKNKAVLSQTLKPVKESLPWSWWADNYKLSFWLGKILKAIAKGHIEYLSTNKKYILVTDAFSDNYFHWLTEVLPKVHFVKHLGLQFEFLFPDNCKKHYQILTLRMMDVNVVYYSSNVLFCRGVDIFSGFSEYPGYFAPQTLLPIRTAILGAIPTKKEAKQFVYVTRKNAQRRRVLNEEEVVNVLSKYGFAFYDFDNLSFEEIVAISRNASVFVSIHGAALTNMMFMEQGATVFELMKANVVIDKCYYVLANALKMKYYYQFCPSPDDNESHIFADITVKIDRFKQNMENIISRQELRYSN